MRIPMLSGSFCKWGLLVLVVFNRLVMLALLVGPFLLVSCHLFLLMMLASGVDPGSAGFSVGDVCFCQILLMMLASAFDAGSAGVFCW